jgi:hypothetical protein
LESEIEKKFCDKALQHGFYAVKFRDPSRTGAPDRMVMCPGGYVFFVEFKRPGEKPRPDQLLYHENLRSLGFDVYVLTDDNWPAAQRRFKF